MEGADPEEADAAELEEEPAPVACYTMEEAMAEFAVAQATEMAEQIAILDEPSWSPSRIRRTWSPTDASSGKNRRRPTHSSTRWKRRWRRRQRRNRSCVCPMYSEPGTEIVDISDDNE